MNRKQLIIGIAGVGIFLLIQAKYHIFGGKTFRLLGLLVVAAYLYHRHNQSSKNTEIKKRKAEIQPEEAINELQDFLKKMPGKRRLYLYETDSSSDVINDRVEKVNENGEEIEYYGIVARPVSRKGKGPEPMQIQAVIWNLTENKFKASANELTPAHGVDALIDPFELVPQFVVNEGRVEAKDGEKQNQGSQQVFVQSNGKSERGKNE